MKASRGKYDGASPCVYSNARFKLVNGQNKINREKIYFLGAKWPAPRLLAPEGERVSRPLAAVSARRLGENFESAIFLGGGKKVKFFPGFGAFPPPCAKSRKSKA
jgi:hypothetical protein